MVVDNTYYDLLADSSNASINEITKSYRRIIRQLHPDMLAGQNLSEKEIEERKARYIEVNKAYEVLKDDEKRAKYDKMGADFEKYEGMGEGMGFGHFADIFDLFNGRGGGKRENQMRAKAKLHIKHEIKVTLKDLYTGAQKSFKYSHKVCCEKCNGNGTSTGGSNTCDVCRGNGIIIEERITSGGVFQRQISCKKCGASGIYIKPSDRCGQCQGSGYINKEENETITIEKGEKDEKVYTFERKGHSSKEDKDLVGDLYVVLSVQSDRAFEKMDDDLLIDIKIDYIEALCGFKRVIKLLDGELVNIQQTINDPPIKPNSVMRIPNLGMPKKNGNGSGNLFLKFEVVFPDEPILKNPSEDSLKNFKGLLKQMNKNNILYDSGNKNIINPDKSQESKRNEKMIFDKKMTEHIFRPAFKNSNSKSQRGNHYTSAPSDDEEDGDQTQQQQYYQSRGGGQSTQCQVA